MVVIRPGPVTVGGVALDNHLLLAAGVLGTTGASLARMLQLGRRGRCYQINWPGTKRRTCRAMCCGIDDGLLNAMGLPNPSKDFIEELEPVAKKPVIASIFGGTPGEFALVAGWFSGRVAV